MNICSSRSHAILCVSVMGHNVINGIKTFGKSIEPESAKYVVFRDARKDTWQFRLCTYVCAACVNTQLQCAVNFINSR